MSQFLGELDYIVLYVIVAENTVGALSAIDEVRSKETLPQKPTILISYGC